MAKLCVFTGPGEKADANPVQMAEGGHLTREQISLRIGALCVVVGSVIALVFRTVLHGDLPTDTEEAALSYVASHPIYPLVLQVYVVWFNMLAGDSRSGWAECVMSDPRATHLWDERRLASRAFAGEVEGTAAPVCDDYLLYSPEATWGGGSSRPISSGYTVYGAREELEKSIVPLLERG